MTEEEKELGVRCYTSIPTNKMAMYFDGSIDSVLKAKAWLGKACLDIHYDAGYTQTINENTGHRIKIGTLEGPHIASPGDYIIRGIRGEFYPCKPDVFEKSYRPAIPDVIATKPGPAFMSEEEEEQAWIELTKEQGL